MMSLRSYPVVKKPEPMSSVKAPPHSATFSSTTPNLCSTCRNSNSFITINSKTCSMTFTEVKNAPHAGVLVWLNSRARKHVRCTIYRLTGRSGDVGLSCHTLMKESSLVLNIKPLSLAMSSPVIVRACAHTCNMILAIIT